MGTDTEAAELLKRLRELHEAYGDGVLTDNAAAHLGDEIWDKLPQIIENLSEIAALRSRVAETDAAIARLCEWIEREEFCGMVVPVKWGADVQAALDRHKAALSPTGSDKGTQETT